MATKEFICNWMLITHGIDIYNKDIDCLVQGTTYIYFCERYIIYKQDNILKISIASNTQIDLQDLKEMLVSKFRYKRVVNE